MLYVNYVNDIDSIDLDDYRHFVQDNYQDIDSVLPNIDKKGNLNIYLWNLVKQNVEGRKFRDEIDELEKGNIPKQRAAYEGKDIDELIDLDDLKHSLEKDPQMEFLNNIEGINNDSDDVVHFSEFKLDPDDETYQLPIRPD